VDDAHEGFKKLVWLFQ